MRRNAVVAKWLLGSFLVVMSIATPVFADGTRNFAGQYRITGAISSAGNMSVTMNLRFFNFSGADVSNATITLLSPLDPAANYLSMKVPLIAVGKDFNRQSMKVTVPAIEYKRWLQSGSPFFVISYTNAAGKTERSVVELVRLP
jgi:protein involved in ribonucleotide reduction